jgi:hypothetical protein
VAAALLVGAALVVTVTHWPRGRPAVRTMSTPRAEVETATRSPGPAGAPGRPGVRARVDWAARLATLDALRARAFAMRDVTLLRRVYAPGPLMRADAALLTELVPDGCGLIGARTRYAHVVAQRLAAARTRITVRATLDPSRLVCAGQLRARAAGRGPTTLRIVVVGTANGLRIAGLRSG